MKVGTCSNCFGVFRLRRDGMVYIHRPEQKPYGPRAWLDCVGSGEPPVEASR